MGLDRKVLLDKKMKELGQSCRELLLLDWSGIPQEEIAKILQTSHGYIRKRKSECVGKLTALIQQSPEFEDLMWD